MTFPWMVLPVVLNCHILEANWVDCQEDPDGHFDLQFWEGGRTWFVCCGCGRRVQL